MSKLLLFPIRLAVGWGLSPRLLGILAVTSLVMLRLATGWHFYTEGIDKQNIDGWTASPFFANAKGPLAPSFRQLVWDNDGAFRLNRDKMQYFLALYREQVSRHFRFDENQKARAQLNYSEAVNQYDWVLEQNAADLEEFKLGRQRIQELLNGSGEGGSIEKQTRDGVASLGSQRETIIWEWNQKAAPTFAQIETLWKSYAAVQNGVATEEQMAQHGPLPFLKPRVGLIDTSVIDRLVPYFDTAIGLCLLFGLFTPLASLAAAGFLISVFLSQLPPVSGPNSTYFQLVEGIACLVLATTGAGRFAGLDYFLHLICRKVWSTSEASA